MRSYRHVATAALLIGLFVGLFSAGGVSAAIIDVTATVPLTDTSYAQDLFLTLFDPSLGQLQSVQVTVSGQLVGGWQYENINSTKASTAFTANYAMDLSMAQSAATNGLAIPVVAKYDGTTDGAGPSGVTIPKINATQSRVFIYNTAPTLTPFIGLGQADFQVAANESDTITTHGKPGQFWLGTYSEGAATVDIQYAYAPTVAAVPEPGTSTLFGLGGIALALVWWRRKNQPTQLVDVVQS